MKHCIVCGQPMDGRSHLDCANHMMAGDDEAGSEWLGGDEE